MFKAGFLCAVLASVDAFRPDGFLSRRLAGGRLGASERDSLTSLFARKPVIGGNWKCNGTKQSVADLVKLLNDGGSFPDCEVIVSPPYLHIGYVKDNLRNDIEVATQDLLAKEGFGAYTGEISGAMIKDFGLNWVITGHSERRDGFGGQPGESDDVVALKTRIALDQGLKVMPCIGEKKEQREAGTTMDVIDAQMTALVKVLKPEDWANLVLAYEPVWAIGTGLTATPQQAQDTHKGIRDWIAQKVSPSIAENVRILYGGSVKAANAEELFAEPDIDGFLVGGASLNKEFIAIINASTTPKKA
uniref:Triosephosphate isomerase n=1 Tax=Chromera velia CCMP2878 TaxID=1169474 RepID=A0A0G4I5M8_9ALVE|eukprot:Cvel_11213.t1-p1 / transcript=Cvel_11213.t1 / gene=Cvel_11213 / organism=Chromera_velia_CCMP2878 / gene_product=Triosephosphate isomerase, cytosolic, putative / transcript_product=Triosephosphate isomerase, cytosolic, putative / location=Cvel_scaffold697:39802-42858(+) / protein_length=302 / sequence_SO=supercontig / SO=protein_coding / is_pseudo=false